MRLENIVWDARDPHRLGRFWTAALGAEPMTDEPDLVESRLHLGDGAFLDLCFPRVVEPSAAPVRLRPALSGGARRLLDLGAERADDGRGPSALADPEGNALGAVDGGGTGPIAVLALDSSDPERDAAFWALLTGWVPAAGTALRHPSGVGPLLALRPEPGPKRGKSRVHLDVRPGAGDDGVVQRVLERGATPLSGPSDHPWRVFADPSGNEFCVLAPET